MSPHLMLVYHSFSAVQRLMSHNERRFTRVQALSNQVR